MIVLPWWLFGLAGALLLVALLALLRQGRRIRLLEATAAQAADSARQLAQDVNALCAGAVGVGERISYVEQRLRNVGQRQERLELNDAYERPYAQAIRLAHKGAAAAEIASTCGLTPTEAELVVMLHRRDAERLES